jgi:uncharacterized surface protein with fasciclin (FAS1) repeats
MANIVDTLVSMGNFTTLVSALNSSGLTSTLNSSGPFTLFAPTDEAFRRLPAATMDNLLRNPSELATLLKYHIISGLITSQNIKDNDIRSAKSLEGENLSIDVNVLGQTKVDGATVTHADIMADNGVIHVINHVLMPGSLRMHRAA